jgi:tRNA-2-methylthio-N6-dimethylallyladenosine synthase
MRGCDNMCSFCVVPYTRGRERSRDPHSIVKEAQDLVDQGYKEVTLLGQNVDSYKWSPEENNKAWLEKKEKTDDPIEVINFAHLLEKIALVAPDLRVRFSTSHPKDITDDVLYMMKKYDNICKSIHLPAQSGNSRILDLMNRTYDREWYINRVDAIRRILGQDCGISSDMMTGFCSETEAEHQDTLTLMDYVQYDFSYMFFYSERPGTLAAKKYTDDIPLNVKKKRLQEIINKQQAMSLGRNKFDLGKVHQVLVEGTSKRSEEQFQGRNTANKVVIFDRGNHKKGDYVNVLIHDCTTATLFGKVVES